MYNVNQFNNYPMQQPIANYPGQQQPTEAQQKVEQAFAPTPATTDANSNQNYQQQAFPNASSQFNVSVPQIPTYQTYPQVQTQINLQGMPPLNVSTQFIDPSKYSVQ